MKTKTFVFFLLCFYLSAYAKPETIAPGVCYKHAIVKGQSVHVLVVNPQQVTINIGMADNESTQAKKTSTIAKEHNAIAAVNGGFFDFGSSSKLHRLITILLDCLGYDNYNAPPVYTLQNNNNLYCLSHTFTGAIGWNNQTQYPFLSTIKSKISLTINNHAYKVNELNKPYAQHPSLYSWYYHDHITPFFKHSVKEVIIENNRICSIHNKSHGRTAIPKNGYIYVIPAKTEIPFAIDDSVTIHIDHCQKSPDEQSLLLAWPAVDNILAGTPLLLHNKQIPESIKNFASDFYRAKKPRTAVGILKNGNWIFVVVDGRQKKSKGFTIPELALFMKKLGCIHALNLDGGGSATMVIHDKVVNSPSGRDYGLFRKERPVSNAIVICAKE